MERLLAAQADQAHATPENQQRAEELIFQAWETPHPHHRAELAQQALELWGDCADGWAVLAETVASSAREAFLCYAEGVAAGERALGEEAFKKDVGHFWGLLETRPYMRSRAGLADALATMGQTDEAIAHYRELLRLNPADNQDIRYRLLKVLIECDRDEEARELLQEYDRDILAEWAYNRALLSFRHQGATQASAEDCRAAIECNRFVPAYLFGRRRLPRQPPDYMGFGDNNEAICYAAACKKLWQNTPGAIEWLKQCWSDQPNADSRDEEK